MEPFALAWASRIMGARIIGSLEDEVQGISTDTRQDVRGTLFFALQGENTDGHAYVMKAFAAGALGAVVSREIEGAPGPLLLVPDTLRALGDLAHAYRQQFNLPVVAVTGSIGKTSTKEMIAAILRTQYNTLASEKNYNNEIGVPMTLFGLTRDHQAAVIEMGMRGVGQIDRLAAIAEPSIGVITNIGFAHAELLGSRQGIAEAKAELLGHLPPDGVAVLPGDDMFFDLLRSRVPPHCRIITFCSANADVCVVPYEPVGAINSDGAVPWLVIVHKQEYALSLQVRGEHQVQNAMTALAVAFELEIPIPQAIAALEAWKGAPGRMTLKRTSDGLTVLDDCYNAAPESMVAALRTLFMMKKGGVAILGDMRELGPYSEVSHTIVADHAGMSDLRLLVTVGALARGIADQVKQGYKKSRDPKPKFAHFTDSEEAAAGIRRLVRSGDTILVKGSRAMEMEKIVAVLTGEQDSGGHD
jgi:UDP-N-acetylmuramoyl-tripeptide--D-alanyl-D-alanine ligase